MEIKKKKRRRGSIALLTCGIGFAILIFGMFFLELNTVYDYQYAIETRIQRAVNSAVEYAMDDRYRSDGYNYMDVSLARDTLYKYLKDDLKLESDSPNGSSFYDDDGTEVFKVEYSNVTFYDGMDPYQAAGIQMDVTVTMYSGMASAYGAKPFTWTNTYSSQNFRTDENRRAGK